MQIDQNDEENIINDDIENEIVYYILNTAKLLIRTNFTNKFYRATPSNEYNKTEVSY
jgi:hypothetical protein